MKDYGLYTSKSAPNSPTSGNLALGAGCMSALSSSLIDSVLQCVAVCGSVLQCVAECVVAECCEICH